MGLGNEDGDCNSGGIICVLVILQSETETGTQLVHVRLWTGHRRHGLGDRAAYP